MITDRDVPSCLIDGASLYVYWRLCASVCTDEEKGEGDGRNAKVKGEEERGDGEEGKREKRDTEQSSERKGER